MSLFTKILVFLAASLFGVVALRLAVSGNWREAGYSLFLALVVVFIGATGWFHKKFPAPAAPPGASKDTWSEVKRFQAAYPGWPGKIVKYGLLILFFANILPRLWEIIRLLHFS